MSGVRRFVLSCCVGLVLFGTVGQSQAEDAFLELKSTHFLVKFLMPEERSFAADVLIYAEKYYDQISEAIGYTRYHGYWTWERRVNIVIYPDQFAYRSFTGQPEWSKAYASRDSRLFRSKVIVSYSGQPNFLDEILPHELSHLMFWDFLDFTRKVPVWFEEGIAQLQEKGKTAVVQNAMQAVVAAGKEIPFTTFNKLHISEVTDPQMVSIFYAQSLSVLTYMVEKFGRHAFVRFCRELREGRDFEVALALSYPSIFRSLDDLERKWKSYLAERALLGG